MAEQAPESGDSQTGNDTYATALTRTNVALAECEKSRSKLTSSVNSAFKTWEQILDGPTSEVTATPAKHAQFVQKRPISLPLSSGAREKTILRQNAAIDRQPESITTTFLQGNQCDTDDEAAENQAPTHETEEHRMAKVKTKSEKWIKRWVNENTVSELWTNGTRIQPAKLNAQTPDYRLQHSVPKTAAKLFQEFHHEIDRLTGERGSQQKHPYASRTRVRMIFWERQVTLPVFLARFEIQFENERREKREKALKNVFKDFPGFKAVLEEAIQVSYCESESFPQREIQYQHLLDFSAEIMRATFISPQWPLTWDDRAWSKYCTAGENPNDIITKLLNNPVDDSVAIIEIKTGKFLDPESGTTPLWHRSQGINPPKHPKPSVMATQRICETNVGCENHQIREKLAVLTIVEFWLRHFDGIVGNVKLTIVQILEKVWFKLAVRPHDFTRQFIHAFDIRRELLREPLEPDFQPILGRVREWYTTSIHLISLTRLEVFPQPQQTFEIFLEEVFLPGLDENLDVIPPLIRDSDPQGPSDIDSFDGYNTTESESEYTTSGNTTTSEGDSDESKGSSQRSLRHGKQPLNEMREMRIETEKLYKQIRSMTSDQEKVHQLELKLHQQRGKLPIIDVPVCPTRNPKTIALLSVGITLKPWSMALKGPIVYGVVTRFHCEDPLCPHLVGKPFRKAKIMAEEVSLDAFHSRGQNSPFFVISSSLAMPTIQRWIDAHDVGAVRFWGSMSWSNTLLTRFRRQYWNVDFERARRSGGARVWEKTRDGTEGAERLGQLMQREAINVNPPKSKTDLLFRHRKFILETLLQKVRTCEDGFDQMGEQRLVDDQEDSDEDREIVLIQRVAKRNQRTRKQ